MVGTDQISVAVVELDSGVDHLLLAELGELVGAQGVVVGLEELKVRTKGGGFFLDLHDDGGVLN